LSHDVLNDELTRREAVGGVERLVRVFRFIGSAASTRQHGDRGHRGRGQ
jgi:hypothetical protein